MIRTLIYGWFFLLIASPWFIGCWAISGALARMVESWLDVEGGQNEG